MKQDLLKGLTEDQIAKVKACGSNEEIFELAKKEGVTLTDEQLEAVNGGGCGGGSSDKCPECGSHNTEVSKGTKGKTVNGVMVTYRRCKDCGHLYYVL